MFAYFEEEPFNDVANNWLPIVQLTATYINAHRKEGSPTVNVSDLVPMMLGDDEPLDSDEDDDEGETI